MIAKHQQKKTLRSHAQERLLTEMIISSDQAAISKRQEPTGYILVLDSYTLEIVNSVVQMKDLTDQKIIGIEKIELKRKPFHKMHAIYFIEPNVENLKKVEEDCQSKTYGSVHLYFTRNIPDSLFQTLRNMPTVLSSLLSFKELNLDFHVIDDCQFNLGMKNIFNQLYGNKDTNTLITIAEKLYTLVSVFLPTSNLQLVTETGTVGDTVGNMVMNMFKNVHHKHKEIVDPGAKNIRLVVLDRGFDVKTSVIHDFHYQSMCYDLIDIKHNTVEFEAESSKGEKSTRKCVLDENDQLWLDYRFKHIAQTSVEHSSNFAKFVKENSTAQLQKGEIDNLDLNKMQSIIRNMPQYGELLVRYSLHMYMAQKALDVFNGSGLKKVGDVEQTIATGVDSQSNLPSSSDIYSDAVKLLGDPMLPADFKLRLAILLNTSIDMNDQNFNIVKNSLSDSSDLKAVDNLVYLGVKNDNSKGKTKSKIPDEMKKVYKKISEDSKYDLTRFTPALTFLLEQIFSDKLNRNKYSSTFYPAASPTKKSLPSELSSFKTNNLSKGITTASKEKLIVFFVGGITFPEIQAAKTFDSSINKSEILTVCGGTSTLTPSAFIQELLGIGFSRGGY